MGVHRRGRRAGHAADPALPRGPASVQDREASALAAAHAWWDAFAKGDAAAFADLSADTLSLTLGVGATLDRNQAIEETRRHAGAAYAGTDWSDDRVRLISPDLAIVTSTATEGFGRLKTNFRYLSVLAREGDRWRTLAAQSTRVLVPTPRLPPGEEGPLADYVGRYRTPNGQVLDVRVSGGVLTLVEPGGTERRLEPIGRDLFELPKPQAASGLLRFLFVRDSAGAVTGMTRLGPEVVTFPALHQ